MGLEVPIPFSMRKLPFYHILIESLSRRPSAAMYRLIFELKINKPSSSRAVTFSSNVGVYIKISFTSRIGKRVHLLWRYLLRTANAVLLLSPHSRQTSAAMCRLMFKHDFTRLVPTEFQMATLSSNVWVVYKILLHFRNRKVGRWL